MGGGPRELSECDTMLSSCRKVSSRPSYNVLTLTFMMSSLWMWVELQLSRANTITFTRSKFRLGPLHFPESLISSSPTSSPHSSTQMAFRLFATAARTAIRTPSSSFRVAASRTIVSRAAPVSQIASRSAFAFSPRFYSAAAGLSTKDISARIIDVLQSFEKVDATKVRCSVIHFRVRLSSNASFLFSF